MLYIMSIIRDYMEYYGLYGKSLIISKNYDYFDFFKINFPGVEMIPRPRGSILHPTRASQLPYNGKIKFGY